MLLTHGVPKIGRLFGEGPIQFGDPIGIGAGPSLFLITFAEVVCAAMVLIGFKTRWAAIPVVIGMLFDSFIAHAADPFGTKEKALLFAAIFLALFFTGPGGYSVDKK